MYTIFSCNALAASSPPHSSRCSYKNIHENTTPHAHHYGLEAGVSASGFGHDKLTQTEINILSKKDNHAETNRQWLSDHNLYALNFISSLGAGKTTLCLKH